MDKASESPNWNVGA